MVEVITNSDQLNKFVVSIKDAEVQDAIYKSQNHIRQSDKIVCSISGGAIVT